MDQQTTVAASDTDSFADVGHGVRICYRQSGDRANPALLLIAGLGQQLNIWPTAFVDGLVARGLRVIRLDNRDIGRSTKFSAVPVTKPLDMFRGRIAAQQYTLADMAADTAGLLDALGLERAHLVGMSMGGMIAQSVAARYPERVLSLTSIMSNTGARKVGQPALSTWLKLAGRPARTPEQHAKRTVAIMRHVGSRGFPYDADAVRAVALESWERAEGSEAAAVARQLAGIFKSRDRTRELADISAPTLVIHGDRDRMVHPTGGRATAAAIPGARLLTIPGMGHDIPAGACSRLIDEIAAHAESAGGP